MVYIIIFEIIIANVAIKGIDESSLEGISVMLHETGNIVWHNVPKLRNVVVIDPQWFADAMAGVVTFISQHTVSSQRGMVDWAKLREPLKLKYVHFICDVHYFISKIL